MKSYVATALLALVGSASAHMAMTYPPPLRSKANPYAGSDIDYSITSPLDKSGSDYPCKGTLNLLGTAAATSVATWTAGQAYNMSVSGGAIHGGGSCQLSLSYDKGKTFTVIHSYVGNCPTSTTSSYDFSIPSDAVSGEALFAWTWFNEIGNREMYMNCAVVNIEGSSEAKAASVSSSAAASFSSRPQIMVANVGNGCSTTEGSDVKFPNPGPDVTDDSTNTGNPVGSCSSDSSSGSDSDSGSGYASSIPSSTASSIPSSTAAASPSTVATTSAAYVAPSSSEAISEATSKPAASVSLPGGIFLTKSEAVVTQAPSSTFVTVTRPAATSVDSPTTTGYSTAVPSSDAGSGSSSQGLQPVGLDCSNEGEWNCVDGKSFQRCASGRWSVVMNMAEGNTCRSGVSAQLIVGRVAEKCT
ncbi:hypothetical protein Cpir12675_006689 [Ceratocystis pirilliformis]|uniref:Extracellular protein n=1 Tax=Ceratocystis pirilliformis TaxID=259994 RepID=A0ABR3YFM2_9PEZI